MTIAFLEPRLQTEIERISQFNNVSKKLLEDFAGFILENYFTKNYSRKKDNSLSLNELKKAIYKHFEVENTEQLKKSEIFKALTQSIENIDLRQKSTWMLLYRKFIGILPDEINQNGYGCINGINIFDYFKPWQVFNLNPQTATKEDIKNAYRQLSKIYHPDNHNTGDSKIFQRIEQMYRSITMGIE